MAPHPRPGGGAICGSPAPARQMISAAATSKPHHRDRRGLVAARARGGRDGRAAAGPAGRPSDRSRSLSTFSPSASSRANRACCASCRRPAQTRCRSAGTPVDIGLGARERLGGATGQVVRRCLRPRRRAHCRRSLDLRSRTDSAMRTRKKDQGRGPRRERRAIGPPPGPDRRDLKNGRGTYSPAIAGRTRAQTGSAGASADRGPHNDQAQADKEIEPGMQSSRPRGNAADRSGRACRRCRGRSQELSKRTTSGPARSGRQARRAGVQPSSWSLIGGCSNVTRPSTFMVVQDRRCW